MPTFADAVAMSALPIVDLNTLDQPQDGLVARLPAICRRHWSTGACYNHYKNLADTAAATSAPIQCPFGFASVADAARGVRYAITGLIPFPRLGGNSERRMAKQYSGNKVSSDDIASAARRLNAAIARLEQVETDAIRKQSFALHEIRLLNRTVKHTAERRRVADPEDKDFLKIHKAAEMMSYQFDIIEVLANESLIQNPPMNSSSLYPLFDKCVRILEPTPEQPRIRLHARPQPHDGPIYADDKTISIVPTCLIGNAVKYSIPNRDIHVTIELATEHGKDLVIARVSNQSQRTDVLSARVFEKGFRQAEGAEGSGHGLYLASLVAKQHNGSLDVQSRMIQSDVCECTFVLKLPRRA